MWTVLGCLPSIRSTYDLDVAATLPVCARAGTG